MKEINLQQSKKFLTFRERLSLGNKLISDKFYFYYLYIKILFLQVDGNDGNASVSTDIAEQEGMGAQFLRWCNAKMLSELYELKFVHQKLHDNDYGENFNNFFGLDIYKNKVWKDFDYVVKLPQFDFRSNHTIQKKVLEKLISKYKKKNVLLLSSKYTYFLGHYKIVETLQKNYFSNHASRLEKNYFNLAVHIRRLSQNEMAITNAHKYRFLPNEYFVRAIKSVIESIQTDKKIQVHIYSEGDRKDYVDFELFDNITWHLNEDPLDTFNDFVFSDALIISPGAYSYYAGLISNGNKYTQNNLEKGYLEYPQQLKSWYELDKNGELISMNEGFKK